MAKEIAKKIKLQIPAGKATPAPPVGTVLGPAGINLQEFCTKFNDASKDKMGDIVPVEITLYADKSYDFILKTAPAPFLIKKYAKIQKVVLKVQMTSLQQLQKTIFVLLLKLNYQT